MHVIWFECIQSVELLFNRLISLKSSEINKLYRQINLLNSLMTKLYKLVLREMRYNFRFLSAKNSDAKLETLSLYYIVWSCWSKILETLFAWWKLEEYVFRWPGRASTRFCYSCGFVSFLVWFQVCKWNSYSVGVKILLGFKNLSVFSLFKSVILEGLCKTFDILHDQAHLILINWM